MPTETRFAPPEDLMREHGALNRILLVYEESARRLENQGPLLPLDALPVTAVIVRHFIEDYHEKLEEDFLFPRFEAAGRLVDLVATLRRQHQAGRRLTEDLQRLATPAGLQDAGGKKTIVATLRSFVRMYRPHECARRHCAFSPRCGASSSRRNSRHQCTVVEMRFNIRRCDLMMAAAGLVQAKGVGFRFLARVYA